MPRPTKADLEAVEGKFNVLVGRYAELARVTKLLRDQCSRAERQVVRLLDRLEAGADGPEAGP